jgi:hypothetical protein
MTLNREGVVIPAGIGIIVSAVVSLLATQFGWTDAIAEAVNTGAEWIIGSIFFIVWIVQTWISRGQVWSQESHDVEVAAARQQLPPGA